MAQLTDGATHRTAFIRGVFEGLVWVAKAVRVVRDSESLVVLDLVPGAECFVPSHWAARQRGTRVPHSFWDELASRCWEVERWVWADTRVRILKRPDEYYAVSLYWSADGASFLGWYVDFELPYERKTNGYDTFDLALDLVSTPARAWRFKDESDYELGRVKGLISSGQIQAVEALREPVTQDLEAGVGLFSSEWTAEAPGVSPAPPLPLDWRSS